MSKIHLNLLLIFASLTFSGAAREYHVSVNGNNQAMGSASQPFRSINFAAQLAAPGDIITVHAGTYREWINPARGGESDTKRIVYQAAVGEKVEIKGSEVITGWKRTSDGTWKIMVSNTIFGNYNPYQDSIFGDWFTNRGRIHHTGELFLNGKSLFEKETLAKVTNPVADTKIKDAEGSTYTWYCESKSDSTAIWANFQKADPNKNLTEISARRTCFYPEKPGINYITIRGFHFSQAATQWAAPTAEQVGMISTHWNKGWIIENNVISDAKCSGITLGKERATGHNVWSANRSLDGSLHYIEVTFKTLRNGWSKSQIGSHIVRNNEIFNCEQTGICGSMGAAFSLVENNHIHHIWTKRQFAGAEIGGIKFHAAIDTRIENNCIHDTGRGLWLDWMAQGTRVSKNLLYNNDLEDLFLEVNHGPTLVDNNLLLSPIGIRTQSQGTAYVHNLISGQITMWPEPNRFTPYHLPHSTEVAGLSTIFSGDDRYYNNLFLGAGEELNPKSNKTNYGLVGYNLAKLPVWIDGNVYFDKALGCQGETNKTEKAGVKSNPILTEKGNQVLLELNLGEDLKNQARQIITTEILGRAKMPNAAFENPDGTSLKIDKDYFGKMRSKNLISAGPFEGTLPGKNSFVVWRYPAK
jgi:hypothetical protein